MPKPGARYNNFERDYRGGGGGGGGGPAGAGTRRVTFKQNRHRDKNDKNNRDWGHSLRAHLEEEDVDMGNTANGFSKKFNKHNKKKGNRSGSPSVTHIKRKLPISNWYRITIPYGNKYDKNFILQKLLSHLSPLPFIPLCWTVNGTTAIFYVDEYKVADKLHNLDREIQYPDGFNMIIKVYTGSPQITVNPDLKEKIKNTMGRLYNPTTKALDLTRFHTNPEFSDTFCALSKPQLLLTAMEIIAKNIPEIEALNLSYNHIQVFAFLKKVNQDLKNLKILHMGNNKLSDITKLDPLIGLNITELVLDGNPLCDRFKEQVKYISEVRKRFPKVLKLDGIDLPPPIGFDIENEVPLPASQQTFLCTQEGQGIVRQFLEQYFTIFDSGNRQSLLQAYHENALFSLTMAYPYGQRQNSAWLDWYATESRNLQRVQNTERRRALLKQGQLAVVSYLSDMPSTKHDLHSFTVDLTLYTPTMLTLIVSGIFKELRTAHKIPPIRHFFKSLVIVPAGSGFCIVNEEMHITNAVEEQIKIAFKTPPTPPPATSTSNVKIEQISPNTNVPDDTMKQQMVQTLAQQTGMNLEWSQKCLQETNWDFQRAVVVFTELHKQGVIPAEAFVK